MVPAPSCPYTWDYWTATPSDYVDLTCLMPNSVYLPVTVNCNATLQDVKEELWDLAGKYPLFGMLHEMSGYVFQFTNSLAVPEEVDDETKRIRDIRPIFGVLMIIERRSIERPGEHLLNTQIGHLIGKGLNDFDSLRSSEVNDFRMRMRYLAEESLMKRTQSTLLERLQYHCPLRLADSPVVPDTLRSHFVNGYFVVNTRFGTTETAFTLGATETVTTQQHIDKFVTKLANTLGIRVENPRNILLKVCGRDEYIFGDYPLIQFLYIQEVLYKDGVPQVMTVSKDKLPFANSVPSEIQFSMPERRRLTSEQSNTIRKKKNYESSWNIERNYSCFVKSVGGLNVDPGRTVEVVCQAGIYHGGKSLCEPQKTPLAVVSKEDEAIWDHQLTFPIKVCNVPRMARLCFVIYEVSKEKIKSKRKGKETTKDTINRIAWANTMIFDYKEQLRTEGVTLFMWTHVADGTQGDDLLLHPLGTVVSNPNTDSCAALQLRFSNFHSQYPVLFPKQEFVRSYRDEVENGASDVMAKLREDFEKLRVTAEKDPMYEMHEQEKKDIWAAREYFLQAAPELLPKLLSCVEWTERGEVAAAARLLARWPRLRLEAALELLDYAYADAAVRSFAVSCLSTISDEELLLYLLQLVQALKHESYLMCDLSVFLLQRAFNNMTIGHYLFWHLRSEMHVPAVSVRFGLVLEAYCRGCQDHINSLLRQITCLDKLKWASQCMREKKEISKARAELQQHLQEPHCVEMLRDFVSPLLPSVHCKRIIPEGCRVMDSKMRPLLLEFENADPTGSPIKIILKIGDDLRQDMFTLQMLRIMDRLWKKAGYDFRLNPYNCISMEYAVGMIEVVEDAETVANIQKQYALFNAASTISKGNLLQWLRKNAANDSLPKVVQEFTKSCAGYCVATYVLGIADRHPDNIMVKKTGALFHIDFGHFLGHFKRKYGFKRERVPFVLTHDFIHVINNGKSGGSTEQVDFNKFKELCEQAFKILRQHGHLILSLFSMMISTGLPELSSEKDLQYLREALVLDLSEEKAMEHFRLKFIEAVKYSWTASINWAFHNFDKNNRQ